MSGIIVIIILILGLAGLVWLIKLAKFLFSLAVGAVIIGLILLLIFGHHFLF
ncbi:hypothetical protein [Mycoplasma sp. 480]|uniref:hypothetical protein n=1 Tax=Mycoplasma sp. 480 TaxID=3440155 RepID=UPI003F51A725